MQNLTILYSSFKKALENSPHIKVIESRSQFDPPSDSRKRVGLAELKEEGYDTNDWLSAIIGLSKGNSMTYHVIRDRQNRGEGSFNFNNPHEFLVEPEPWVVKNASSDADAAILKQVRVIDQPNVAQTFTGVLMEAGCPPEIPQKLVYFRRGHLLPMNLSFQDYYHTLAAYMGIVDWQLLYTDAMPSLAGLEVCFEQLTDSYEALGLIFPDRDFSIWGNKLSEKGLLG